MDAEFSLGPQIPTVGFAHLCLHPWCPTPIPFQSGFVEAEEGTQLSFILKDIYEGTRD